MYVLGMSLGSGSQYLAYSEEPGNLAMMAAGLLHHGLIQNCSINKLSNVPKEGPGPTQLGKVFLYALQALEHGLEDEPIIPTLDDRIAKAVAEITATVP